MWANSWVITLRSQSELPRKSKSWSSDVVQDLNCVLIKKSCAIGVVVVVLEHDPHAPVRSVPIQLGNGRVRGFGNARRPRRCPFQPLVVENAEVLGLHYLPR